MTWILSNSNVFHSPLSLVLEGAAGTLMVSQHIATKRKKQTRDKHQKVEDSRGQGLALGIVWWTVDVALDIVVFFRFFLLFLESPLTSFCVPMHPPNLLPLG